MTFKQYLTNVLISIDQLINTIFWGCPDETLSARAYRNRHQSKVSKSICIFIDLIFFWQKNHCKHAYESELKGKQNNKAYKT